MSELYAELGPGGGLKRVTLDGREVSGVRDEWRRDTDPPEQPTWRRIVEYADGGEEELFRVEEVRGA